MDLVEAKRCVASFGTLSGVALELVEDVHHDEEWVGLAGRVRKFFGMPGNASRIWTAWLVRAETTRSGVRYGYQLMTTPDLVQRAIYSEHVLEQLCVAVIKGLEHSIPNTH